MNVLSNLIFAVQIILAVVLVVLMAVQTDKAEQGGGGVMGLGAANARTTGNIDMAVGAERILKPMTKWIAIGFLCSCILNAIPAATLTVMHILSIVAIYLVLMLFGGRVWSAITRSL